MNPENPSSKPPVPPLEDFSQLSQEEALRILKSLRPKSGTDPNFDYEKGELKPPKSDEKK